MPVLSGNTSGSIIGIPYNIPCTIESIVLTNMTGGAVTATLSIIEFGTNNKVAVVSESLAANASFRTDVPIKVLAGFTAYLVVSGSTDYYLSVT
jgi:hypothetical protein